jgi:membrane associated rhomboid family serine protease
MADDLERPRLSEPFAPLVPMVAMLAVMWAAELVDTVLGGDLDRFGIRPRQFDGLDGIVLSPFLHGGFGHLIANSLPFLIMGAAICVSGARAFVQVTLIVGLVAGVGTWLTGGSDSVHIGASGLVFGYLTYLMARGVFARQIGYLIGGVITFVVYGGVLWGLVPRPGISWQGHLFGALGGVVAAWALHGRRGDDEVAAPFG